MTRRGGATTGVRLAAAALVASAALGSCTSARAPRHPAATPTTVSAGTSTVAPTTTVATTTTSAPPAGLCGFLGPAQAHYTHVMWIWMENHPYRSVIGSASAPFENGVAAQCGLATNYHNVTHPSLPNYLAATSGLSTAQLGPFYPDCDPSASCSAAPGVESIFSEAPTWRSYAESMPYPCARGSSGEYAARHNPAVYYRSLGSACTADDVPIAGLYRDVSDGDLPAFSFVTPNLVDDTHDGSVAQGDAFLRTLIGDIAAGPQYRSGSLAVFVVWDEGEGGSASDCATNTTDVGCHVPALVLSASTQPGTVSATLFNHYSLLRTAEDLLGLRPLGEAAGATGMASAFGLGG